MLWFSPLFFVEGVYLYINTLWWKSGCCVYVRSIFRVDWTLDHTVMCCLSLGVKVCTGWLIRTGPKKFNSLKFYRRSYKKIRSHKNPEAKEIYIITSKKHRLSNGDLQIGYNLGLCSSYCQKLLSSLLNRCTLSPADSFFQHFKVWGLPR